MGWGWLPRTGRASTRRSPVAEILADDPARLLRLSGRRIDIGGIDQPAAVGMELAAGDIEAGVGVGHQPGLHLGEHGAHQPDALLAVAGQGQQELRAVAAPGFDIDVIPAGMEAQRLVGAAGDRAAQIGLHRRAMARPSSRRPRCRPAKPRAPSAGGRSGAGRGTRPRDGSHLDPSWLLVLRPKSRGKSVGTQTARVTH